MVRQPVVAGDVDRLGLHSPSAGRVFACTIPSLRPGSFQRSQSAVASPSGSTATWGKEEPKLSSERSTGLVQSPSAGRLAARTTDL